MTNYKLIRVLIALAMMLSLGSMFAVQAQDEEDRGVVRMARANWDTGYFQAEIFAQLLTRLGYEVERTGDIGPDLFYPALAEGEDVDMWVNGWLPLHITFLTAEDVLGRALPVGYEVENGALQGFLVDRATADEFGITNIEDMTDPDIAALFDTDGDGLADLTGCNAGWGCEAVIEDLLDTFELRDSITHVQGEYALLMSETVRRFQRGEPVFFYTWTPNWTVNELALGEDVVWINTPDVEAVPALEGVEGCISDPCEMGFEGNDIRAVANTDYLMANPAVAALMSVVEIPLEDIAAQNQMMQDGDDSDDDIIEQANMWLEENAELVEEWLAFAEENAENTDLVQEALDVWLEEVDAMMMEME